MTDLTPRKPAAGEWLRLCILMGFLIALGLVIVFVVGHKSGTPTRRSPMAPVSASP